MIIYFKSSNYLYIYPCILNQVKYKENKQQLRRLRMAEIILNHP